MKKMTKFWSVILTVCILLTLVSAMPSVSADKATEILIYEDFENYSIGDYLFDYENSIKEKTYGTGASAPKVSDITADCKSGTHYLTADTLTDGNKIGRFESFSRNDSTHDISGQWLKFDLGREIDCASNTNGDVVIAASFYKYNNSKYPCFAFELYDNADNKIAYASYAQNFISDYNQTDESYALNEDSNRGDANLKLSYFGTGLQEIKFVFSPSAQTLSFYYDGVKKYELPYIVGQTNLRYIKIGTNKSLSGSSGGGFALDDVKAFIKPGLAETETIFSEDFEEFGYGDCIFKNGNIVQGTAVLSPYDEAVSGKDGSNPVTIQNSGDNSNLTSKWMKISNGATQRVKLDLGRTFEFNNETTGKFELSLQYFKTYSNTGTYDEIEFYDKNDKRIMDLYFTQNMILYSYKTGKSVEKFKVSSTSGTSDKINNLNNIKFEINTSADNTNNFTFTFNDNVYTGNFGDFGDSIRYITIKKGNTKGVNTYFDKINATYTTIAAPTQSDNVISDVGLYSGAGKVTEIPAAGSEIIGKVEIEQPAASENNVKEGYIIIAHYKTTEGRTRLYDVVAKTYSISDYDPHRLAVKYTPTSVETGDEIKLFMWEDNTLVPVIEPAAISK